MRLERLDLTRYGKFTDQVVDFGPAGTPDLHVIHGANEAGKSTFLKAWLDLLFRMEERSDMNFLHDYKSMQLGATLTIGGRTHEVTRIKKRDGSLLDSLGAPVPESLLSGALFGMDRGAYSAMFSLNRHTLEAGGESILASQGDLGELLFQASAGLSDLSEQLAGHDAGTRAFLSASGRAGHLREQGKVLAGLADQIKALDTQAAGFAKLAQARDTARDVWHDAQAALDAATRQRIELEALRAGQRAGTHLQRLDEQIAGFGALTSPPADWLGDTEALDRAETELRAQLAHARKAVDGLRGELQALPEDAEILRLSDAIRSTKAIKAAHDTALDDLPKRDRERSALTARMAECLGRLGRPDSAAAELLPEAAVLGRLRALVEDHGAIFARHHSATQELATARTRADQATARLTRAGGGMADPGELRGLVTTLRAEDPRGAADRAQAALDSADTALQGAMQALAPWHGTTAELAALTCPTRAAVAAVAQRLGSTARQVDTATAELDRCEEAAADHKVALDRLRVDGGIDEAQAAQARAHREAAWADHRARLDAESAEAFEQAMRLDDRVAATLASRTAMADRAREAGLALTRAEEGVTSAREALKGAQENHTQACADLQAMIHAISPTLPGDMGAEALQGWLERVATARTALITRDDAARSLARAQAVAERSRQDLLAALARAGRALPDDSGLGPALESAQALLDDATALKGLAEQAEQAAEELSIRQRMEAEAGAEMASWQADWAQALAGTAWADPLPAVAEMRVVLEELNELREILKALSELTHRIEAMEHNRDQFRAAVTSLASQAGMAADGPLDPLWQGLSERWDAAQATAARRADLRGRLERATQEVERLEQENAGHRARVAQRCSFFGVEDWDAARAALARAAELAELTRDRAERAEELCDTLGEDTVAAALERLDGADATQIATRIERLTQDLKPLQVTQEEAHAAYRDAEAALAAVGGDGEVARLEEARQTCLVEIEEGARAHLRARLGLLAVEDALRRYRDSHRSGMMTRASQAFAIMTGGAYGGLTTQTEGNREVLVALPQAGGSKQATQLSEGTRAQLYLALRIAGYHEFVAQNGPVPFIADDIMESFDDDRARATFGLLAEMSRLGQVIYLTHHSHLRDLAQAACDGVRVQELR